MTCRSGSGCVITFVTSLCKREGIKCVSMAVDINDKAAEMTVKTSKHNQVCQSISLSLYLSSMLIYRSYLQSYQLQLSTHVSTSHLILFT